MKSTNKIAVILFVSIVAGLLGSFRITMKPSLISSAIDLKPSKLESSIQSKFWQCAKGFTLRAGQECKSATELMDLIIERTRKPGYIVDGNTINLHITSEDYEWLATQTCYSECTNGMCACPEYSVDCLSQVSTRARMNCKAQAEELRQENSAMSHKELGAEVIALLAAADSAMDVLKECTKSSAITTGGACELQANNRTSSFGSTFLGYVARALFLDYDEHCSTKQYLAIESQRCVQGAECKNNICVCSSFFNVPCQMHSQKKTYCYLEAENVRKAYAAYAKAVDRRRISAVINGISPFQILLGMMFCIIPFFIWKSVSGFS